MSSLMRDAMRTAGKDLKLSTKAPSKPGRDDFDDGFGDLDFDEPVETKPAVRQPDLPATTGSYGRVGTNTLQAMNPAGSAVSASKKLESFAQREPEYNSTAVEQDDPFSATNKAQVGTSKMTGSWMMGDQSEVFDAKGFANTFFAQLEDFGNLRHKVPEEINSFHQYDEQYKALARPDVTLDLKLQLEYLNAELQQTLSQLRGLERAAEQAASVGKDKRTIVSLLYERKDAQNKVALLNAKKTDLLGLNEALELFDDLAELSKSYANYQKVVGKFLAKNSLEIDKVDPDPLIHTSLAYQVLQHKSNGLAVDKEPVTDYMCLEYAEAENAQQMRLQIEREYKILMDQHGTRT